MPLKSPGANNAVTEKAFPVRTVVFSRLVRVPGYDGACTSLTTIEEDRLGVNRRRAKSLVVVEGINSKLIVDGTFFMPLASGTIDGWIY